MLTELLLLPLAYAVTSATMPPETSTATPLAVVQLALTDDEGNEIIFEGSDGSEGGESGSTGTATD